MVEGGGNAGEISGMWRLFLGREVGRRGTSLFAHFWRPNNKNHQK
jgi:hypothetical protein